MVRFKVSRILFRAALLPILLVFALQTFGQTGDKISQARDVGGNRCIAVFSGMHWDCIPLRPKTVFVTSATYDGNLQTAGMGLNGLQGADNICNAHAADGIVPPGDYIAWLSTDIKHARDRLPPNNIGYVLPDGSELADSKSALLDAQNVALGSAINQNEFGVVVEPQAVWTGSSSDGTRHWSGYNCFDWTHNGGGVEAGTAGETKFADERWSSMWSVICYAKLSLYCFQR